MRSALCDDQRTTEPGRAVRSGQRVTAEREEGESGDNTCGDTRTIWGHHVGCWLGCRVTKWVSGVSETYKKDLCLIRIFRINFKILKL